MYVLVQATPAVREANKNTVASQDNYDEVAMEIESQSSNSPCEYACLWILLRWREWTGCCLEGIHRH